MDISKVLIRQLSAREWRRFVAFRSLPADSIDPAFRQQILADYDVHFYEYGELAASSAQEVVSADTVTFAVGEPTAGSSRPQQRWPEGSDGKQRQLVESVVESASQEGCYLCSINPDRSRLFCLSSSRIVLPILGRFFVSLPSSRCARYNPSNSVGRRSYLYRGIYVRPLPISLYFNIGQQRTDGFVMGVLFIATVISTFLSHGLCAASQFAWK